MPSFANKRTKLPLSREKGSNESRTEESNESKSTDLAIVLLVSHVILWIPSVDGVVLIFFPKQQACRILRKLVVTHASSNNNVMMPTDANLLLLEKNKMHDTTGSFQVSQVTTAAEDIIHPHKT